MPVQKINSTGDIIQINGNQQLTHPMGKIKKSIPPVIPNLPPPMSVQGVYIVGYNLGMCKKYTIYYYSSVLHKQRCGSYCQIGSHQGC